MKVREEYLTCMATAWDSFLEFLEIDQIGLESEAAKLGLAVLSAMVYGFALGTTDKEQHSVEELRELEDQVITFASDDIEHYPFICKIAKRWAT